MRRVRSAPCCRACRRRRLRPGGRARERPAHAASLYGPAARHPYPHGLDHGQHGFEIGALSGPNTLVRLDGTDAASVVNLGQLAARTIVPGDFASEVPAVQEALF